MLPFINAYRAAIVALGFVMLFHTSNAFQAAPRVSTFHCNREKVALNSHGENEYGRRQLLFSAAFSSLLFRPSISGADEDLTSQMFNPDGSLKEGLSYEAAKTKQVDIKWDQSDSLQVNVDGQNVRGISSGSQILISYALPGKWGEGYIDKSEGVNAPACKRITVYKAPGKATADRLEKATTIGVGKALDVTDDLRKLRTADIIGGRKRLMNEQKYYEFDMASAPDKCAEGASKDDLGLGFCPYDSVFLISSTIKDESLYVMAIECDNLEWKQGNAELKQVRASFSVESIV